jgi:hypothetical protein
MDTEPSEAVQSLQDVEMVFQTLGLLGRQEHAAHGWPEDVASTGEEPVFYTRLSNHSRPLPTAE